MAIDREAVEARLVELLNRATDLELRVIKEVAEGIDAGRQMYGELELEGRDWSVEAGEEIRDALVYIGAKILSMREPQPEAESEPEPTPVIEPGDNHTFEVGPGREHDDLATVPWPRLGPGDTVRIHWREVPYRQRVLISTSGASGKPIRIEGVANQYGDRPEICGADSEPVAGAGWRDASHADLGLIVIYIRDGQEWEYRPENIRIKGLHLADGFDGAAWMAGICALRVADLDIVDCEFVNNVNGVFIRSVGPGCELSERVLVSHSQFANNGASPGGKRAHHIYAQGREFACCNNKFFDVREGSEATCIKDRGPGTIVDSNYIAAGNASIPIDLVEPDDHLGAVIADPDYHRAWVRNNTIECGDVGRVIHFGADVGKPPRMGELTVLNNDITINASDRGWYNSLLGLDDPDAIARISGNTIRRVGGRPGAQGVTLLQRTGTVHVGEGNRITSQWGWSPSREPELNSVTFTGLERVAFTPTDEQ